MKIEKIVRLFGDFDDYLNWIEYSQYDVITQGSEGKPEEIFPIKTFIFRDEIEIQSQYENDHDVQKELERKINCKILKEHKEHDYWMFRDCMIHEKEVGYIHIEDVIEPGITMGHRLGRSNH